MTTIIIPLKLKDDVVPAAQEKRAIERGTPTAASLPPGDTLTLYTGLRSAGRIRKPLRLRRDALDRDSESYVADASLPTLHVIAAMLGEFI